MSFIFLFRYETGEFVVVQALTDHRQHHWQSMIANHSKMGIHFHGSQMLFIQTAALLPTNAAVESVAELRRAGYSVCMPHS